MSEYTDYGITIPTDGSDFNLWGAILNEQTFPLLFKLVTGIEAISLTGDTILTNVNGADNQARNLVLNFTDGGLAAQPTVTIPGVEKVYLVNNGGSTYSITFSAGGVTASIEAGYWGFLLCTGSDCQVLSLSSLTGNEIGDNLFRIKGSADATKKLAFEVDGFTTATTRTVTVPNSSGTMVLAALAQALQNKTFADGTDATKVLALALSGITTATTRTVTVPDASGVMMLTGAGQTTVPSATTTDIGASKTVDVIISGTTTITGFGTVAAGTIRHGYFTGALTLTHNGTSLILPGAANITTANGDSFTAESLGSGNWKVLHYTKADGTAVVSAAGGGMTLLGTLTTTSGTTQSLTSIPPGYRHFYYEVENVGHDNGSSRALRVALSSTNGAAYGTPGTISAATSAANGVSGVAYSFNVSTNTAAGAKLSMGIFNTSTLAQTIAESRTNTLAVADAVQFSWDGAGNFDSGVIRIYGVK